MGVGVSGKEVDLARERECMEVEQLGICNGGCVLAAYARGGGAAFRHLEAAHLGGAEW